MQTDRQTDRQTDIKALGKKIIMIINNNDNKRKRENAQKPEKILTHHAFEILIFELICCILIDTHNKLCYYTKYNYDTPGNLKT